MYQVMIADDEELILQTLSQMIQWNALGFELAGCYRDGSELLEALEYNPVDLIVTDIKMSQVSGLEVAKYIHEKAPYCKVLLISGYLEFQLAVEAMAYGVAAYLPKPLDLAKLREELEKVRHQLDEQRRDHRIREEMSRHLAQTRAMMKEKLFSDLAFARIRQPQQLLRQLKTLYPQENFDGALCFLCECTIDGYGQYLAEYWMNDPEQLENSIQTFFQQASNGLLIHCVYLTQGVLGLYCMALRGEEAPPLASIQEQMRNAFHMQTTVTLKQNPVPLQALFSNEFSPASLRLARPGNDLLLQECKQQILANLCEGNLNAAQDMLYSLCAELNGEPPSSVRQVISSLLMDMTIVLERTNPGLAGELRSLTQDQTIFHLEDVSQMRNYLLRLFDRLKTVGMPKLNSHPESFVEQAQKYVCDHIMEDISREDVAESLYICATYLSRLFRQQTGETFNQYLIRMKVAKAIELLKNPRYKVYEVCNMLGYKTPRHFSNLFRSHMGVNPSEYRRSVLHLEVAGDE